MAPAASPVYGLLFTDHGTRCAASTGPTVAIITSAAVGILCVLAPRSPASHRPELVVNEEAFSGAREALEQTPCAPGRRSGPAARCLRRRRRRRTSGRSSSLDNEAEGITSLDPAFARNLEHIWVVDQPSTGWRHAMGWVDLRVAARRSEQWTVSDSGTTCTFHLRPDARFTTTRCSRMEQEGWSPPMMRPSSLERLRDPPPRPVPAAGCWTR